MTLRASFIITFEKLAVIKTTMAGKLGITNLDLHDDSNTRSGKLVTNALFNPDVIIAETLFCVIVRLVYMYMFL
ncbi:hypothetical protein RRG08_009589 [Elysia crispata]|uniref:Uncharacterized protein n=1 Tax=Elysia crispata TaxID=231223 RepID=A0AAE1CLP9_9GAST|nr:hypothetical protein RRG08_009589 [Elysia crispata]